jgi:peroxiredoxin
MTLLLTLLALALAPGDGDKADAIVVDDFACLDQHGTFQRLSRHADARLVVLYVFQDDCPIVRHNAGALKELMQEFAPRGVRFLGLDPAPQDAREGVAAEAEELGLELPILLDDTQCVAEMLGLTRSAEALVIGTKDWNLRWRGPLDDRMDYGAQRPQAEQHYLRAALEALLVDGTPPEAPPAKGCALTYLQPRDTHVVEYVRDVAPLLAQRCVPCHSEGGIGPWAMNKYEKVRGFGAMVRDVLLTRRMTPWQVDPAYGHFRTDFALTSAEVRTLVHWVERGAPRGEGEDVLAVTVEPLPEWPLGPPDLIVEMPEQKIPATGQIPYRKYTVKLDLPEERWVRAVDLRPSNAAVLHHGFAFIRGQQEAEVLRDHLERLPPAGQAKMIAWLAENGGTPENPPPVALKYFEKRAFQGIRTFFSKYTPGEGIEEFPAGTGKLLPANPTLSFQMHYTTNGVATSDRPRLGIYFLAEAPKRELKVTTAVDLAFVLPPGERSVAVHAARKFDQAFELHAVSPHMHYRGRSMRYTAVLPDGTREMLFSLPEYRFDWQTNYVLAEPRCFPAGTVLEIDGVFDNSRTNEFNPDPEARVKFGPRTEDEMFVGYAIYTQE